MHTPKRMCVSCKKNNAQQPKEEEQKDETPAAVEFTFTYYATQDMLDFADIQVTYNDGTADKTENGASLEWTKTVKATLPVSFKFDRKVTQKEGVELSTEKTYSYTKNYSANFRILNAKGEKIRNKAYTSSGSNPAYTGDKIATLLGKNSMDSTHSFDFDKDGKCPQLDPAE